MDLSFSRFDRDTVVTALPAALAVLLAAAAGRQAACLTARLHARLALAVPARGPFAVSRGAFNPATAAMLMRWQQG